MPAATEHERHLTSPDPDATSALGLALGRVAQAGDVVCLWGDLGAGKTHLAKAFGAGLGVTDTITSPSFILMAEYAGRLPLFHIDLYRLADATDALAGGLIDDRQAAGVTLVEWPERLGPALPARRLDVVIDGSGDEPRTITLRAVGDGLRRYLEAVVDERRPVVLAIDSATTRVVVAARRRATARCIDALDWPAGYRHGETLLPAIDDLLGRAGVDRIGSDGRGRRHRAGRLHRVARRDRDGEGARPRPRLPDRRHLDRRGAARRDSGRRSVLLLPAGPSDRLLVRHGQPARLIPAGTEPELEAGETARRGRPRRSVPRPTPWLAARPRGPAWRRRSSPRRGPPRRRRRRRPGGARARVRDAAARRPQRERGGRMVARPSVILRIEPMRMEDLPAVHAIERASFDAPWPPEAYRTSSRRTASRSTWSRGSATRSRPTAGCG